MDHGGAGAGAERDAGPAPSVAQELYEYCGMFVRLLPAVALSTGFVVAMLMGEAVLRRRPDTDKMETLLLGGVITALYFAFLVSANSSSAVQPRVIVMGTLVCLVPYCAGSAALILLLPEDTSRLTFCVILGGGFGAKMGGFSVLEFWSTAMSWSQLGQAVMVVVNANTAGYAISLLYAALVHLEDKSPLMDIFLSGFLFPVLTAGMVRVILADFISYIMTAFTEPSKRDTVMVVNGIYARQVFHSIAVWVQVRMVRPDVFFSSLGLSAACEVLGTLAIVKLSVSDLRGFGTSTVWPQATSDLKPARRGKESLLSLWLEARGKENSRERLGLLYFAEEIGERANVMVLGIAGIVADALEHCDLRFAVAKCVAVVLVELVEDLVKKRLLWNVAKARACRRGGNRALSTAFVISLMVGPGMGPAFYYLAPGSARNSTCGG